MQGDGDYDVICPVACYVNHGATPAVVNAEVTWNVEAENLQIRTTRALDAGTEVPSMRGEGGRWTTRGRGPGD